MSNIKKIWLRTIMFAGWVKTFPPHRLKSQMATIEALSQIDSGY
jgi:hypothetical protein